MHMRPLEGGYQVVIWKLSLQTLVINITGTEPIVPPQFEYFTFLSPKVSWAFLSKSLVSTPACTAGYLPLRCSPKEIFLADTGNLKWEGGNSWIKAKWTIICQQYPSASFNLLCTSKEPLSSGDLLTFSTSCCVFIFIFSFCGQQKNLWLSEEHCRSETLHISSQIPR